MNNLIILNSIIFCIVVNLGALGFFKYTNFIIDNQAEILNSQPVSAIYNEEAYVVEGLPETVDVTLIGRKIDMYLAKQLSTGYVTVDISGLKEGTHKVALNYESNIESIDYIVDPSTVNINIYPKVSTTKTAIIDTIKKSTIV